MIASYRLHCGLPLCCVSPNETKGSVTLRASGLVLSILSLLTAALILSHTPWLAQAGSAAGWSILAAGTILSLLSLFISCKNKNKTSHPQQLPSSAGQISGSSVSVRQYGAYQVLLPSLHELPLKEGYHPGEPLDFETIQSRLDTLITLAGSPKNLQKLNIFPLPYRLLEEGNLIVPDFNVHRSVFAKPVTVVRTEKETRYIEGFDLLPPLKKEEPVVFSFDKSWSSHEFKNLPGWRFFIAHNGVQLEIGYIHIGDRPYELLSDDTIRLLPTPASGGSSEPPLLN